MGLSAVTAWDPAGFLSDLRVAAQPVRPQEPLLRAGEPPSRDGGRRQPGRESSPATPAGAPEVHRGGSPGALPLLEGEPSLEELASLLLQYEAQSSLH